MKKKTSLILVFLVGIATIVYFKMINSSPKENPKKNPNFVELKNETTIYKSLLEQKKYASEVRAKIEILKDIFLSKNDNDLRLDTEFKDLNEESKKGLRDLYQGLPQESLNERGTIVFLLGREINQESDLTFFKDLLEESACLSLIDCSVVESAASRGHGSEDHHLNETQSLTLIYPQIMGLKLLNAKIKKTQDGELKESIINLVKTLKKSSSDLINSEVDKIIKENENI